MRIDSPTPDSLRFFAFHEKFPMPSGGCIGGGGQPRDHEAGVDLLRRRRQQALYQRDAKNELRLSYENPDIKAVYEEFLGKPLGEKSERLLHTM